MPHARAQHGTGHQPHIYVHASVLGYEKAGDMPLVRLLCRAAWRERRTPANQQQRPRPPRPRYLLHPLPPQQAVEEVLQVLQAVRAPQLYGWAVLLRLGPPSLPPVGPRELQHRKAG
jgi:hypothetical protein